ncbi:MAG: hypothetical protein ABW220_09605 [Burkholderiaceae bacterium]
MNTRTPPMQDATLIDALNQATSLELYQLSMLLERLITDPRRIVAVRKDLHLGQVVRFYDGRRDTMREGRIIEMRDAQVTLHDTQQRVQWKLPYAAIEPPQSAVQPDPATPPAQPTPPASPRPTRADFARGDKVSFTDRHLQTHVGVITRSNPKTATIDTGEASWSVSYGRLRRVIDI